MQTKKKKRHYALTGCLIYIVSLFLFLVWISMNLWDRWNQLIEPVPTTGFDMQNFQQLVYPQITLCNIIPGVEITHNKCSGFDEEINCEFQKKKVLSTRSYDSDKEYNCLEYNGKIENAFVATKNGIQVGF